MTKLKNVIIHKYKSIETDQSFDVEDDMTVLVGMNESGKTSILEALAKSNYFENDEDFKFELISDYPRKEKKKSDKSGETPTALTLTFVLDDTVKSSIKNELDIEVLKDEFSVIVDYTNQTSYPDSSLMVDASEFVKKRLHDTDYKDMSDEIASFKNKKDFEKIDEVESSRELSELMPYFENKENWDNPIAYYVYTEHIIPAIPKFIYYDEYYSLPSEVSFKDIKNRGTESSTKTARALIELADLDVENLESEDYENVKAELEATQADLSEELLEHWSSNRNLKFRFEIDKKEEKTRDGQRIVDRILKIRVENVRAGVTLPLEKRSKGFNWFFSFLVWFKKIQADKNNTYILLLDEPGLNLHARAQNDLLRYMSTELSRNYQVIYTTHSPFMIDSSKLSQARTVVETEKGTKISNSIQERDKDTLFPLQAALGYDLAQNLFVSPKNLVVEGVTDFLYLDLMNNVIKDKGREYLRSDVTIVPVGGADKVSTFISLLSGNKLELVCLLDTISNPSLKSKLEDLKNDKILPENKLLFFDEFTRNDYSDVEDMFEKFEYLRFYNGAFDAKVDADEIDDDKPLMNQLKKIKGSDFNHYAPAYYLMKNAQNYDFSDKTLERFEELFARVNILFG